MRLLGLPRQTDTRRKPDGWLVRISVRLASADISRLGAEADTIGETLAQRVAVAANPEDDRTVSVKDQYLLVIRPGRRKSDSDDPRPVVQQLLADMAKPVMSSIGPIFPRLNAAFTRTPCITSDKAVRTLLIEGLEQAEISGSGVAIEIDPSGGEPELLSLDTAETKVASALKRAIDSDQVVMHYQPVVSLANNRIASFEALMRVVDENGSGLLSPAHFIGIAERSGLIHELGRIALRVAAEQMAAWRSSYGESAPPRIAVNIAAPQLANSDFVAEATKIFADVGLSSLTLELTESARIQKMPEACAALAALREGGAKVALDDFGVEYSNLAYLRDLDVDIVKIDRSFLDSGVNAARAQIIVSKVVELAHLLDARVVVEGVSTPEQVASLVALGIDYGQGELFGLGMDAEAATRLIEVRDT